MPSKKIYNVIIVAGYSWSGSSAVVDLLHEFKTYQVFGTEFRLINDPGGIIALENALINGKSSTIINQAIKNFKNLSSILGRKFYWEGFRIQRIISKFGWNYNELMDNRFYDLSNDYIHELTDLEYDGSLITDFYNMSYIKFFLFKIYFVLAKIFGKKRNRSSKIIIARPKYDDFLLTTRNYLNNLCDVIAKSSEIDNIVLDQAIQPNNIEACLRFFHSPKILIIDRDPRDIFVEASRLPFYTSVPVNDVECFIKWFRLTRSNQTDTGMKDFVLNLRFEELITNYQETVDSILKFMGEDSSIHIEKNKFLDPSVSIKNVEIWKKYHDQNAIKAIEKKLSNHCWNINF